MGHILYRACRQCTKTCHVRAHEQSVFGSVRFVCALPATWAGGPTHAMEVPLKTAVTRECLSHVKRQRHPRDSPSQPSCQVGDDTARPCCLRGGTPSHLPGGNRDIINCVSQLPWKDVVHQAPLRLAVGISCSFSLVRAGWRVVYMPEPERSRPTRYGRTGLPSRRRISEDGLGSPWF